MLQIAQTASRLRYGVANTEVYLWLNQHGTMPSGLAILRDNMIYLDQVEWHGQYKTMG